MAHRWFGNPKATIFTSSLLTLVFIIACGAAATETPGPTVAPTSAPITTAPGVPGVTPQPTPTPALAAQPKRGGVVPVQAFGNPDKWDPHESGALTGIMVTSPLYNQLIEYNPETDILDDLRCDLCQGWELAPDGMTYTFHLNEKAKWWDGKPVTAEDVVFSLERMAEPDKLRPRAGLIRPYYQSSRAIDPYTMEIKTKFPAPAFLPVLATDYMAIMPKHHVETGVDLNKPENILGSGPFRLKSFEKDVAVKYERNPGYFKEPYPYFDGMNYYIMTAAAIGTIIAAYKTEQVLFCATMVSNLQAIDSLKLQEEMKGKLTAHRSPPIGNPGLAMNTKVKPFNDVRVRRAIYLAVDRQANIKIITGGFDILGTPMPPGFSWGPTENEVAEMAQMPGLRQPKDGDIAEAKRLLAEAGYPNGFKTTLTVWTVVEFVDLNQLIAEQLRKVGIDVTVKPVELASGLAAAQAGDWELGGFGEGPIVMDPDIWIAGAFMKGGVRNYSNWSHPRIDQLYELQQRELDPVKRKAYVDEIAKIILTEDSPWVTDYWTPRYWLVNNKIKNFHMVGTVNAMVKNEHLWLEK